MVTFMRRPIVTIVVLTAASFADSFIPNNSGSVLFSVKTLRRNLSHSKAIYRTTQSRLFVETEERKVEVEQEAADALASVGWAPPSNDEDLTSDDPFVKRINDEIRRDMGVELDELLNPATVVNLERELYNLRSELASATGKGIDFDVSGLLTQDCDGGEGGEEAETLRTKILKKEKKLFTERRSVFRGWLKNVFLGQAVLSVGLSYVMATNPSTLFSGIPGYVDLQLDQPIKVLGFWWWWLFIVPSLRSRRPTGLEKKALDVAFLGTPIVSLLSPVVTKEPVLIWVANFAVVAGCYGYAYLIAGTDDDNDDDGRKTPGWLKFVYKSLDFGSGQERGAR